MLTGRVRPCFVFTLSFFVALWFAGMAAMAQSGSQGTIVVSVDDPSGGLVPDASLTLVAMRTNDTRTAQTTKSGTSRSPASRPRCMTLSWWKPPSPLLSRRI
jgi:hypothetical protein